MTSRVTCTNTDAGTWVRTFSTLVSRVHELHSTHQFVLKQGTLDLRVEELLTHVVGPRSAVIAVCVAPTGLVRTLRAPRSELIVSSQGLWVQHTQPS